MSSASRCLKAVDVFSCAMLQAAHVGTHLGYLKQLLPAPNITFGVLQGRSSCQDGHLAVVLHHCYSDDMCAAAAAAAATHSRARMGHQARMDCRAPLVSVFFLRKSEFEPPTLGHVGPISIIIRSMPASKSNRHLLRPDV
jgi:hypothetical protein